MTTHWRTVCDVCGYEESDTATFRRDWRQLDRHDFCSLDCVGRYAADPALVQPKATRLA